MINFIFLFQFAIFYFFIIYLIVKNNQKIKHLFYLAISVRIFAYLISNYIPFVDQDMSILWEQKISEAVDKKVYSGESHVEIMYTIVKWYSYFYEHIGSFPILARSLSILAGSINCVLAYNISLNIWKNDKHAKISFLLVCFYPLLINYSVLTLREVFIVTIFLSQIFLFVKYYQKLEIDTSRFFFLIMCISLNFFHHRLHGAMQLSSILFTMAALYLELKFYVNNGKIKILKKNFKIIFTIIIFVSIFIFNKFFLGKIPYLNDFKFNIQNINFYSVIFKWELMQKGSASFPSYLIPNYNISSLEMLFFIILRSLHGIFGPFLWEIRKLTHLIIYADSFVYLIIFLTILLNFKKIINNPIAFYIFVITLFLFLIYSIGSGNYGSALRHRTKFISVFFIMCSPYFFNIKEKIKKLI